jgi:hypothetical protein
LNDDEIRCEFANQRSISQLITDWLVWIAIEFRGKAELTDIRRMILFPEVDHNHMTFKIININISVLEKADERKDNLD